MAKKSIKRALGQVPGTVVYIGDKQKGRPNIDGFEYDRESFKEHGLESVEDVFPMLDTKGVTWINFNGLDHVGTIEGIGTHCKLHPLILEDIANTLQRPKMEEYEGYIFLVVKMPYFDNDGKLRIEHLSIVLGTGFLLTFQESEGDVFEDVRNRIRTGKGRIRSLGADYLLFSLLDAVVDNYFTLLESLGEKVEALEDDLLKGTTMEGSVVRVQELKREILKIRKAVVPMREVVNRMDKDGNPVFSKKTLLYLRGLYDHVTHVAENVEVLREMVWGLMDMYLTTISNRTNDVMKILTIVASIFIPLTFLAGIYGMNFEYIPELGYRYGYFVLIGVMLLIFIGLVVFFKRRNWL
ncbi:magnesium/cobalt transporter CorA [Sediminicola luteus]|uniref:Magnesium transport protein CorA n=1 Tax=Sediminicola luteus TaxID=319238 RepID=A0A2A4G2U2_9FLAO|nr:magnesium/cobalt transporter CorA [Sediminicola luteus]PCE62997.1 magnesium and cobalt transport protein CorA [Sediminicola luteus]